MILTLRTVLSWIVLCFTSLVFVYYFAWTILLPFVDTNHRIRNYFPEQKYAVIIPCFLLVMMVGGVGTFVGFVLIKEKVERGRQMKGDLKKKQV